MQITLAGDRVDFMLDTADSLSVVRRGGGGGPLVLTAEFQARNIWAKPPFVATIAIESDGTGYQDAAVERRRGARAAVPFALGVARRIASGELVPSIERTRPDNPYWRVAFSRVEHVGKFERRAVVAVDLRSPDAEPDPSDAAVRAAQFLKLAAQKLHAAIDLPENRLVFGAG